ncbi:hypothetical protein BDL97_03G143400 [Sphagnum fallax]|nr:hypothetical protein BDL97_03G143400 [Sphagnum fallax]KAH8968716.1 hypothetical protein BDL97_03G143400 [Sphagnum fallax]KAH8968717.1 hypothetical protein BDL97_03G143400 [Sphagnum fallax]
MAEASVAVSRSWPYFDPEYQTGGHRYNPPRVVIDNDAYEDVTVVKFHSANRHGILLRVVQVLTDLELAISKAYISSDGEWFMDVFHVTDLCGNKVSEERIMGYIQQTLGAKMKRELSSVDLLRCPGRSVGVKSIAEHTVVELTGKDRPGLLSEVSAVLTETGCNVNAAEVWTHNLRAACVLYVTDEETQGPIANGKKLERIKELLFKVMEGGASNDENRGGGGGAKTDIATEVTHTERRLHQMMFADRDYEALELPPAPRCSTSRSSTVEKKDKPVIAIQSRNERGYSVINVACKDRPKLLFDIVCTLTDMQYVVFHATVNSKGTDAVQEYYIRHVNGCTLDMEAEKWMKQCLEAAIDRRSCEGLRLELCTNDRVGLLSHVTRVFRENGLSVTRADVATQDDKAVNVFYVTNASGDPIDTNVVETLRQELGHTILEVKEAPRFCKPPPQELQGFSKLTLVGLLRFSERFLYGLASLDWKSMTSAGVLAQLGI